MIPDDPWFLSASVVMVAAARDAECRPTLVRNVAVRQAPVGRALVAYLPVPEGLQVLEHVSANGHIALTISQLFDYRSMQFKGTDARLAAYPDDAAFLESYRAANEAAFVRLGIPREAVRRMMSPDVVAVTFTPAGAWDMTPGANAGRELLP